MKKLPIQRIALFMLLSFIALTARSQVTIGDGTPPSSFSVLEISTASTKGGLRLPHLDNDQRDKIITDIKAMPAGQAKDDALKAVNGLTIYNTETQCTEYWDSREWISLCTSSASFSFNDDDIKGQMPVDGEGGSVGDVIPGGGSGCNKPIPYTVDIVAGAEYLESTDIVTNESTGAFKVTFLTNPTAYARYVVVRVTDNCTNLFRDISLQQAGNTTICVTNATIPEIKGNNTQMCQGAELPLWIDNPDPGYQYIWLFNGKEINGASGTTYVATREGKYTVVVGALGCPNSTSVAYTVTQEAGAISNPPVVSATNGGVICGGSFVRLSARINGTPVSVDWYHNGIFVTAALDRIVNAQSDEGTWTAYATGTCGSKQSNPISVTYDGSSGGGLPAIIASINGTLISGSPVLCKGGSMQLKIENHNAYEALSPRYEWYINGNEIYRGTDPVKTVNVPDNDNMLIEIRVITGGNCPISQSMNTTLNPTELIQPNINNGKAIDYVCGSSQDISLSASNVSGSPTKYQWYKDGGLVQETTLNEYSTRIAGKYQVRYTDGACWSKLSTEIELVSRGYLSLIWAGEGIKDAIIGAEVTVGVTAVPEALSYTWTSSDPSVIKVTQLPGMPQYATLQYLAVGTATISVTATNECGDATLTAANINSQSGCAEAENLRFTTTSGRNPASIQNKGTGNYEVSFTGGVSNQKIQWTIQPPTGAPTIVPGIATNNLVGYPVDFDQVGKWTITATAYKCDNTPTGKSTTMTVMVTPTTDDLDNTPLAPAIYSLSGKYCFDTYRTNTSDAGRENSFAGGYTFNYVLSGTPATDLMAFTVGDSQGVVESITINGTTISVTYKASVVNSVSKDGVIFQLTVVFRGTSNNLYKLLLNISVKDDFCCPGYVSKHGEYIQKTAGYTSQLSNGSNFGTTATLFDVTGKNVCFFKIDGHGGSTTNWANAVANCNNGNYVEADYRALGSWRLPNIAELGAIQNVYNTLATQPASAVGTANMLASGYWSSTELNSTTAWRWAFTLSTTTSSYKTNNYYVRCVQSF